MTNFWQSVILLLIVVVIIAFVTPMGRAFLNSWDNQLKEIDEATLYENKVKVEDTARSMISSYEADVLTYEQYKGSTNKDEVNWANSAKMRANRTASTYNNFILKNSHVWKENVPADIFMELKTVE